MHRSSESIAVLAAALAKARVALTNPEKSLTGHNIARLCPVSDFSGLVSATRALASAAARTAIDSLDRCMASLRLDHLKADRPRFRVLGADPMAECLLGVLVPH